MRTTILAFWCVCWLFNGHAAWAVAFGQPDRLALIWAGGIVALWATEFLFAEVETWRQQRRVDGANAELNRILANLAARLTRAGR